MATGLQDEYSRYNPSAGNAVILQRAAARVQDLRRPPEILLDVHTYASRMTPYSSRVTASLEAEK